MSVYFMSVYFLSVYCLFVCLLILLEWMDSIDSSYTLSSERAGEAVLGV